MGGRFLSTATSAAHQEMPGCGSLCKAIPIGPVVGDFRLHPIKFKIGIPLGIRAKDLL